jgi:hypothetical protein
VELFGIADAPVDDEPLTAADEAALAEAEQDLIEGKIVSHEEARHLILSGDRRSTPPHSAHHP